MGTLGCNAGREWQGGNGCQAGFDPNLYGTAPSHRVACGMVMMDGWVHHRGSKLGITSKEEGEWKKITVKVGTSDTIPTPLPAMEASLSLQIGSARKGDPGVISADEEI
ncbi:hypothetical protein Bbelb_146890 [Branchiostoma belcheri]|nr:hypothetical protein Bbelb_146890 [Branchiostoma belcheri]